MASRSISPRSLSSALIMESYEVPSAHAGLEGEEGALWIGAEGRLLGDLG